MEYPASEGENSRSFCWEQVLKTNRLFQVSRVFAPPAIRDRLLPLYALFSIAEQLASTHSEEQVARSKLAWWQAECLQTGISDSPHPVCRELRRCGAAGRVESRDLMNLLTSVGDRLDAPPPPDLEHLRRACAEVHQPQWRLERAVCDAGDPRRSPGEGARNGLLQLVRESARGGPGAYWWMPLDVLARNEVSREEIRQEPGAPKARACFDQLIAAALHWGEGEPAPDPRAGVEPAVRHASAMSGLYRYKLGRTLGRSPDALLAEINRVGFAELVVAWKSARGRSAAG
jgi:phytoene synthase